MKNVRILYKDIGDYSVAGGKATYHRGEWLHRSGISPTGNESSPDEHHDWLEQSGIREYQQIYVVWPSKEAKSGKFQNAQAAFFSTSIGDCESKRIATLGYTALTRVNWQLNRNIRTMIANAYEETEAVR